VARTRLIFFGIVGAVILVIVLGRMVEDRQSRPPRPTRTPTSTLTSTFTPTPTSTPTATFTPTPTSTPTPPFTPTPTRTPAPTPVSSPTVAPTPTLAPTPGPEFVENCDESPTPLWDTFGGGTWITTNGRCMFLPTSGRQLSLAITGFPYWRDYLVELDVHYTRADKDDYCGVLVLAKDQRNYLLFSMGGRGERTEWWMFVNGDRTLVPETQRRSAVKDDTIYHVRVEVSGGKIVTYLDGKEASRFGTRQFGSGLVGLLAYSERASPGRLCAFDNLRVSPLAP